MPVPLVVLSLQRGTVLLIHQEVCCSTCDLLPGWVAAQHYVRVGGGAVGRYSREDESGEEQEETGWKYIHGDVFRFPPHPT